MRSWKPFVKVMTPALALSLALSLALGACTSKSGAATSSPAALGTSQTGATSGPTSPSAGAVAVAMSNFSFAPSTVNVKGGDTISLQNTTSSTPHSFTIDGQNIDVVVSPGATSQVKIDLPPGTYQFFCHFHKASGMTGTLIVGS